MRHDSCVDACGDARRTFYKFADFDICRLFDHQNLAIILRWNPAILQSCKIMRRKLYIGPRLRLLRESRSLTLEMGAERLGLSTSYLSQLENNHRPVTASVLVSLARAYQLDPTEFDVDEQSRLIADLREASMDLPVGAATPPIAELRLAATTTPHLAHQFLALHAAYRRLEGRVNALDDRLGHGQSGGTGLPAAYEAVRDFFHYRDNYVDELDTAAEALAGAIGIGADSGPAPLLEQALRERHGVTLCTDTTLPEGVWWRYDAAARALRVAADLNEPTRLFQMGVVLARLSLGEAIEQVAASAFHSPEAIAVGRLACENYAAGALLFPYGDFARTARALRHDVEQLQRRYRASFEQICHRLSTLQRPGARGIPFYFVRVDQAGTITKRHSSTRFQFARFGGACPLWNVHESFSQPGRIMVQVAEMPDSVRYLCMARSIIKRSGSFRAPNRHYAVGFGCELRHAGEVVYADAISASAEPVPIGISCRICERRHCHQRAFPPMDHALLVPADERGVTPYRLPD